MKRTAQVRGQVANGVVVLDKRAVLPEGMRVVIIPELPSPGSPAAILAGMRALPIVDPEDVEEILRNIESGKRRIDYGNPLTRRARK